MYQLHSLYHQHSYKYDNPNSLLGQRMKLQLLRLQEKLKLTSP